MCACGYIMHMYGHKQEPGAATNENPGYVLTGGRCPQWFFFLGGGGAAGIREHMSCIRGISRLVGVLTGSASSSPVTLQGVMECIDGNRAPASD